MAMYDDFAEGFSKSRKNMKWGEIDYFLDDIQKSKATVSMLDIGCGSGRLLESISEKGISVSKYLGVDNSLGLLEEAKKSYPDNNFQHMDMQDIGAIPDTYDAILFIASFHHLSSIEERENVLLSAYRLLKHGGKIYMTNWALESDINKRKYSHNKEQGSENIYGGTDYNIKFGDFDRYYHCFTLKELEILGNCSGFQIVENRLFENQKNFVTILTK